jgi:glycine dehydrogenase subunit 1
MLGTVPGVEVLNKSFFNEMTIRLPVPAAPVRGMLASAVCWRRAGEPAGAGQSGWREPHRPRRDRMTTDGDIDMLAECLHATLAEDLQ